MDAVLRRLRLDLHLRTRVGRRRRRGPADREPDPLGRDRPRPGHRIANRSRRPRRTVAVGGATAADRRPGRDGLRSSCRRRPPCSSSARPLRPSPPPPTRCRRRWWRPPGWVSPSGSSPRFRISATSPGRPSPARIHDRTGSWSLVWMLLAGCAVLGAIAALVVEIRGSRAAAPSE